MASAMRFPTCIFFILAAFGLTAINATVPPRLAKKPTVLSNPAWKTIFLPRNKFASRSGLTGDSCSSDSDCLSDRTCLDLSEAEDVACSSSSSTCACIPDQPETCTASSECTTGEGCATLQSDSFCVSCGFASTTGSSFVDDGGSCSGNSGDTDNDDDDDDDTAEEEDSSDGDDSNDGDGDEGESDDEDSSTDDEDDNDDDSSGGFGIPNNADDDETDSDSNEDQAAVCVSVQHLQHLSSSELVFSEHRRASVLCDGRGSCATPGHIVIYHSQAMTMQRFCKMVSGGCSRRVMQVNSPRMRYGLRVDSFTEGLQFTPLSAKYETGFEEAVLKMLVHFGM